MYHMYDASVPPKNPPDYRVVAGYFGSGTPHDWSAADWNAQKAEFRLPIIVHTGNDVESAAQETFAEIQKFIADFSFPEGKTIVIDTEDYQYGVFLTELDKLVTGIHRKLMNYGSLSAIQHNAIVSGGRWSAHWDDVPKLDAIPDCKATQYADSAMIGTDYDLSVIDESVALWRPADVGISWQKAATADLDIATSKIGKAKALIEANTK